MDSCLLLRLPFLTAGNAAAGIPRSLLPIERGGLMPKPSVRLGRNQLLKVCAPSSSILHGHRRVFRVDAAASRANTRKENPKGQNRRLRRRFNGSSTKPRLSVFCSDKQLYAMLIDDQNKNTLFYASTLQKSIRGDPLCNTIEAAQKVGEELVKACVNMKISEISSYDRNGFAQGERVQAFEIAVAQHGFLPR